MYRDDTPTRSSNEWLEILEDYFREQNRAFLIFDRNNLLLHFSEYARDILELNKSQIGLLSVYDLFPQVKNNPDIISDQESRYLKVNNFTYTTPSGKPMEVRFNLDRKPGINGYVVWVEPRMRDNTSTFRRITTFEVHKNLKPVFDAYDLGFMIINKQGLIIDHNETIQHILRLPGEWEGRNIFTFPPLYQISFGEFIENCITSKSRENSKVFKINYSSKAEPVKIRMSVIKINDLSGTPVGALISCKTEQ